jgi:Uma2 family endonuclease
MSDGRVITDQELLNIPKDGHKYEVVDGQLVATQVDMMHEMVIPAVAVAIGQFAEKHHLGEIIGSNALYVLPNSNKRSPDLSFLTAERYATLRPEVVFPEMAPDLAVEVLCQFDTAQRVLDRIGDYIEAGVRLVWVIDPMNRRGVAYRSLTDVRFIGADGELDGEDVLPGFRCRLSDLFD